MITGSSTKPGTTGSRKTGPRFETTSTWRKEVKRLRKATGLVRIPPNFRHEGKWGWHQAFRKKWALLFPLKSDGTASVDVQRQLLVYLADTGNTYSLEVLNTRSNAGIGGQVGNFGEVGSVCHEGPQGPGSSNLRTNDKGPPTSSQPLLDHSPHQTPVVTLLDSGHECPN